MNFSKNRLIEIGKSWVLKFVFWTRKSKWVLNPIFGEIWKKPSHFFFKFEQAQIFLWGFIKNDREEKFAAFYFWNLRAEKFLENSSNFSCSKIKTTIQKFRNQSWCCCENIERKVREDFWKKMLRKISKSVSGKWTVVSSFLVNPTGMTSWVFLRRCIGHQFGWWTSLARSSFSFHWWSLGTHVQDSMTFNVQTRPGQKLWCEKAAGWASGSIPSK